MTTKGLAKNKKKPVKGVTIRGADGRLYFIPKTKLKLYALEEEHQARVAEAPLKRAGEVLSQLGLSNSEFFSIFHTGRR